jgi:hypothetical protein
VLVLACLLAVLSVVAVFARNELLNTDAYVKTVAPLASNPAIQTQVAKQVSTNLLARVDLEQQLAGALRPKAQALAKPIAAGVATLTNDLALKVVQSKQFANLWVSVNRASHKQLVAVLTGSSEGAVSSKNGKATINLGQVEVEVKQKLDARGLTMFNKVPAVKGLDFVLFQSSDLTKVQQLTKWLNDLAIVLPIVTLLCFAADVVLTRNRRRGLVRAAAGLALSMALILVVLGVARNQYLSGLSPSQSVQANSAVIDIVTEALKRGIRIILVIAAVVAILALLAGDRRVRAWLSKRSERGGPRSSRTLDFVLLHRAVVQWLIVVAGALALVIWPSPTTLVAVVVVAIALLLAGVWGIASAIHASSGGSVRD